MRDRIFLLAAVVAVTLALSACSKSANEQNASSTMSDEATPTAVVKLDVQGMTCTGCEAAVKMALKKVDGVQDAEASYAEGTATVKVDPQKVDEQKLIDALGEIGYTAKKQSGSAL